MNYEAKIILDSISPAGKRLTTITATYPRFIHCEILTHRDRARNSASSRAIPFPAMLERIDENPVVPLTWPGEQNGMQGGPPIPEALRPLACAIWLQAYEDAKGHAKRLRDIETYALNGQWANYGKHLTRDEIDELHLYSGVPDTPAICVHKSIPNRIVEPWMWITVVMTATEWENFFRLRCHSDAEIHFQKIAGMIREAIRGSVPAIPEENIIPVSNGEDCGEVVEHWHMPFVTGFDLDELVEREFEMDDIKKISVARCARVSYLTHEQTRDPAKDIGLFDRLVQGSGFGHWSAHEHVAQAADDATFRSGPYVGWKQYRKQFANENVAG